MHSYEPRPTNVCHLPATRRILAFPRCGSHPRQTLAGSSEIALGRAGADLGPTWGHLGANLNHSFLIRRALCPGRVRLGHDIFSFFDHVEKLHEANGRTAKAENYRGDENKNG